MLVGSEICPIGESHERCSVADAEKAGWIPLTVSSACQVDPVDFHVSRLVHFKPIGRENMGSREQPLRRKIRTVDVQKLGAKGRTESPSETGVHRYLLLTSTM